jgi:hypothetical protein
VPSSPGPDQNAEQPALATRVRLFGARLVEQARGAARVLTPWLSLLMLCLLFELPRAFVAAAPDLSALRLSLELPLLLTLAGLVATFFVAPPRSRARVLLRRTLWLLAFLLLALRLDQWICWLLMREEPLLYDQWFMAKHLGVLIGDVISPTTLAVLLGVAGLAWLTARLVRRLLRQASQLVAPARRRHTAVLAALFWSVALGLSALPRSSAAAPRVGWLTPLLIANLHASRDVYERVQSDSHSSPHARFAALTLHDKPDVLLFIVESYGRLLSVDPGTRDTHRALLSTLTHELARTGWHAASAFSTSTVSGGRSWIAEGTMLMGLPIRYESVFQHLIALRPSPPSLVGFLRQRGYYTTLLAPADRNRPGAYVVNRYGFSELLTHDGLAYRGRPMGWGIVPDQYSLAIAEQRVLLPARARKQPVFLDFHMVTSHAPWAVVPPLYDDPSYVAAHDEARQEHGSGAGTVLTRLARYDHKAERRFVDFEHFDQTLRDGYQATVHYDLKVIAAYLARRADDAVVILIGDHQPPVLSRSDQSFDSPVHLLSRDPQRLQTALARGFVPGLWLEAARAPAMSHDALFSLLVETLAAGRP